MTHAPQPPQTNAAGLILEVLRKLRTVSDTQTTAFALAYSLPCYASADSGSPVHEATMRIAAITGTIHELSRSINACKSVEPEVGGRAVGQAHTLFYTCMGKLQSTSGWMKPQIEAGLFDGFKWLSHSMPKDRSDVVATERQELIVAMAALRSLESSTSTHPAVAAELAKIVRMLDEGIIQSYLKGPDSIGDIMVQWRRLHIKLKDAAKVAESEGADLAQLKDGYVKVAEKAVKIADSAIRVDGLVHITKEVVGLLT